MADLPGLAVYSGAATLAQALVAWHAWRARKLGRFGRPLALLFLLNALVAAVYTLRVLYGFGIETSVGRLLAILASVFDTPTGLVLAFLAALLLASETAAPPSWPFFVAWLPYPVWLILHMNSPPGGPVEQAYSFALTHWAYAILIVAAGARLAQRSLPGHVAPVLLGAVGMRAAEFVAIEALGLQAGYANHFHDFSNALRTGVPEVALVAGVFTSLVLFAAAWSRMTANERLAGSLIAAGLAFGVMEVFSRTAPTAVVSLLSTFTLFVVRPIVVAGVLLPRDALAACMSVLAGATSAAILQSGFRTFFGDLDSGVLWGLGAAVAVPIIPLYYRALLRLLDSPVTNPPRSTAMAAVAEVRQGPPEINRVTGSEPEAVEVSRWPPPLRVLVALWGSQDDRRLYQSQYSHAGLSRGAAVSYKKLSAVLRKLEQAYVQAPETGPLVRDYGFGRRKFYRLTPRGVRAAEGVLGGTRPATPPVTPSPNPLADDSAPPAKPQTKPMGA